MKIITIYTAEVLGRNSVKKDVFFYDPLDAEEAAMMYGNGVTGEVQALEMDDGSISPLEDYVAVYTSLNSYKRELALNKLLPEERKLLGLEP